MGLVALKEPPLSSNLVGALTPIAYLSGAGVQGWGYEGSMNYNGIKAVKSDPASHGGVSTTCGAERSGVKSN